MLVLVPLQQLISIGGGTRGALGAVAPTKFVSAHRNLVFHNRNVSR